MRKLLNQKTIFLASFLALLISFNPVYAMVLDRQKAESGLSATSSIARDERKTPQYAPGEVIVKLKEYDAKGAFAKSYSVAETEHDSRLRALERRYNLEVKSPVFRGLHNRLRAQKTMSLNALQAQMDAKFPQRTGNKPKDAKKVNLLSIYVLRTDKDVLSTCAKLNKDPDIEYAQPNYMYEATMVPDDPYYHSSDSWGQGFDDLWALKADKLNMEPAWDISQGEGILVAVVDTGIDYNHADIAPNVWINPGEDIDHNGIVDSSDFNGIDDDENGYIDDIRGYDFTTCDVFNPSTGMCVLPTVPDPDPFDGNGHGTHVSGTIAAVGNNDEGIIGVAPEGKILPVRGLNDQGMGYTTDLANAIVYATDMCARIINNSWGPGGHITYNPTAEEAVRYAFEQGALCVFAAGNKGDNVGYYSPANMRETLTVASTDHLDLRSDFSNWGDSVDVAAPGGGGLEVVHQAFTPFVTAANVINNNFQHGQPAPEEIWDEFQTLGQQLIADGILPQNIVDAFGKLENDPFDPDWDIFVNLWNAWVKYELSPAFVPYFRSVLSLLAKDSAIGRESPELIIGDEDDDYLYLRLRGTSMAAPHASGVAALALSQHPQFSSTDLRWILRLSADELVNADRYIGYGRINAAAAVSLDEPPLKAYVSSPAMGELVDVSEGIVEIRGAAGGSEFVSYKVLAQHLSSGSDTLLAEGFNPIPEGGLLAAWDVAYLNKFGSYQINLVVTSTSLEVSDSISVALMPLQSGWPSETTGAGFSTPFAVNIDDDPELEVIGLGAGINPVFPPTGPGDDTRGVYAWNSDGTEVADGDANPDTIGLLATMPIDPMGYPLAVSPLAFGNLDSDPALEIVVGANDNKLYAINGDGTPTGGLWPVTVGTIKRYNTFPPIVADIDMDGINEVIDVERQGDSSDYLVIFNNDGTIKDSIYIPPLGGSPYVPNIMTIAVGTFYSNERKQVVVSGRSTVHIIDQGQIKETFTVTGHNAYAITGDVDKDGSDDIVVRSYLNFEQIVNYYTIFDRDGNVLNSWQNAGSTHYYEPIVLANFDTDPELEIITVSTPQVDDAACETYVWDHNNSGAAKSYCPLSGAAPVFADLDSDGLADMLTTFNSVMENPTGGGDARIVLSAWNRAGQALSDWPIEFIVPYKFSSGFPVGDGLLPITITDIDRDGDLELITGYLKAVLVMDLTEDYNITTLEWPMSRHDFQRSACYVSLSQLPNFDPEPQNIEISKNEPITIEVKARDNDPGDTVDINIKGELPEWLSIEDDIPGNPAYLSLSGVTPKTSGNFLITFEATDGKHTVEADMEIRVINQPPVAYDQDIITDEDTPIDITLTAQDPDGDHLDYFIVTKPEHGTLEGEAPELTYRPKEGYHGDDNFTFKANDGETDSNEATVSITILLGAPSDLKAEAVSSTQIDLHWQDNSNNEYGFKIERRLAESRMYWKEIATVDKDVTEYGDKGLTPATAYEYRVRAYNEAGNSKYSNITEATTHSSNTPPEMLYLQNYWNTYLVWLGRDREDGYRLNYSHRVDEGKWSRPSRRRYVRISEISQDLEPGVHIFQVKAIDTEGAESDVKSIEFEVMKNTPPEMLYLQNYWNTYLVWLGRDREDGYRLNYSHRVDEGKWSRFSPRRYVLVSDISKGLEPGTHLFQVKARDTQGAESAVKSVKFETAGNAPPEIVYLMNVWNKYIIWLGRDKEDGYHLNYSCRVDEGEWSRPSGRRYVRISEISRGLKPGEHLFEVKAIDTKGTESDIKSIEFEK